MQHENSTMTSNQPEMALHVTNSSVFRTAESSSTQVEEWSSWYEELIDDWDDFSAIAAPIPSLQIESSAAEHQGAKESYLPEGTRSAPVNTMIALHNEGSSSYCNGSAHTLGIENSMQQRSNDSPIPPSAEATRSRKAPMTMIGSVYSTAEPNTYIFKCGYLACQEKTFGRWYDLKRHHDGAHASHRTTFWCHIAGCQRSAAIGVKPFPRKDKLRDHVRKVHTG